MDPETVSRTILVVPKEAKKLGGAVEEGKIDDARSALAKECERAVLPKSPRRYLGSYHMVEK